MQRGRWSAEGVGARIGKRPHSTKDGNPYGWLAHGRCARGRGFDGQATFIGWKRSVFKTHTGVPYKEFCPSSPILETVPYDRVYQLNYYRLHRELQLAAINYPV